MAAPRKQAPTPAKPVDNFDDLLNENSDDVTPVVPPVDSDPFADPVVEPAAAPAAEDPEDEIIRQLEAAIAKPLPEEDPAVVAKRNRIKDLEDQLARRNAAAFESGSETYDKPTGTGETVLIHVLIDGFSALGRIWVRGQELEFEKGGEAWKRTLDKNGKSWVDLANDPAAQDQRWGQRYIGSGPFVPRRGEVFDDSVSAEDARRGRAVPLPPRTF